MNKTQKKILNYFKNQPPHIIEPKSKNCKTISEDTGLKISDVIQYCYDLDLQGKLSKRAHQNDDPEYNGYVLTALGRHSLDTNWTQIIIMAFSGIAAIGAIISIALLMG